LSAELKKLLLRKGGEVAAALSALLDHKEVDLASLPPPRHPDDDPELRLRRFLDQIDRAIKAFDTERYGKCALCGAPIDSRTLADRPWTELCGKHPIV
jgi:RNA polymerase-binding transcription factor DksA